MAAPMILAVDPHKSSHTVVTLDATGEVLDSIRISATRRGLTKLDRWINTWPQRQWAVEGAFGLGHQLAQHLVGQGERVTDVPASLSARVRMLSGRSNRKTDTDDALAVGIAALHNKQLRTVGAEDHTQVCKLLSDERYELTHERNRKVNRLHRMLRDMLPGGAPRDLQAGLARRLLRQVTVGSTVIAERVRQATDLIRDIGRLDKAISANRERIKQAVAASKTTLTEIPGIVAVGAAWILGEASDIGRFHNRDAFAAYCGVSPVEASSGDRVRHRLNQGGNRRLNNALSVVALTQSHRGTGRAYIDRKRAEGKSRREALRSLKRHLANVIYRRLLRDQQASSRPRSGPLTAA